MRVGRIGPFLSCYRTPEVEGVGGGGNGAKKIFAFDKIPSFARLSSEEKARLVKGRTVFLRLDLNLKPKGESLDPKRLDEALPIIREVSSLGGISFIASHRSEPKDPEGQVKLESSMRPVFDLLRKRLPEKNIYFVGEVVAFEEGKALSVEDFISHILKLKKERPLKAGDIVVLENLRYYPESVKDKKQVEELRKAIADNFDIYLNDAFGTVHRNHASMTVPLSKKSGVFVGPLMQKEMDMIKPIIVNPKRPFIGVLGGAKIAGKEGKIEVLKGLLPWKELDYLLVGGAMGNTFLCAKYGWKKLGSFSPQQEDLEAAAELLRDYGAKLILPKDVILVKGMASFEELKKAKELRNDQLEEGRDFSPISAFPEDAFPADLGPKTLDLFREYVRWANTIFANGPISVYEQVLTARGMNRVIRMLEEAAVMNGAYVLGGGGDFLAAVKSLKEVKNIKLSTGGGALLAVVAKKGEVPAFTAFFE